MKTYATHAEYLADCTDVAKHRDGSVASYRPPAAPFRWQCAHCAGLFDAAQSFARTPADDMICYSCADARQREQLRDRSRPFSGYVSGDGRTATTWTGGLLGHVVGHSSFRGNRGVVHCYSVRDVHGGYWHGRSSGPGMFITLRPSRG